MSEDRISQSLSIVSQVLVSPNGYDLDKLAEVSRITEAIRGWRTMPGDT